jgi:hypothetical protein
MTFILFSGICYDVRCADGHEQCGSTDTGTCCVYLDSGANITLEDYCDFGNDHRYQMITRNGRHYACNAPYINNGGSRVPACLMNGCLGKRRLEKMVKSGKVIVFAPGSDAEDSDAEDSDTEDSDTEDSDAQDSDDEESDNEDES